MIEVHLPWPDKKLLPNARPERYERAEIVKRHRFLAKIETIRQATGDILPAGAELAVDWTFYPPDKRHRDYDGMITAGKAYQDGIFDALGLNDHLVRCGTFEVLEPRPDGLYVVKVRPAVGGDIISATEPEPTFIE